MDISEEKTETTVNENTKGRARIYSGDSKRYVQELEMRRRSRIESQNEIKAQAAKNATDSKEASAAGKRIPLPRKKTDQGTGMRRYEKENLQKLYLLYGILAVLVIMLIVAIIFEVIL